MMPLLIAVPKIFIFSAGMVSAMNTYELVIDKPAPTPMMNRPRVIEPILSHI